eukprot:UN14577
MKIFRMFEHFGCLCVSKSSKTIQKHSQKFFKPFSLRNSLRDFDKHLSFLVKKWVIGL